MPYDVNTDLTRLMLRDVVAEIKKIAPHIKTRKDAWVINSFRDTWEFQTVPREGIQQFYTFVRAYNAYEARTEGWSKYMDKFHPEWQDNNTEDAK